MSSKSRKNPSQPARNPKPLPAHPAGEAKSVQGEVEFAEPSEKDFLDEVVKTPKGKSPLVYAFLVLLLIFLTVIFILPEGAMQGGGRNDRVEVRWTDPVRGERELRSSSLMDARARFETVLERGGAMAVFGLVYTGFISNPRRPTDLDIVRLVIADEQATRAGIEISDSVLAETVRTRVIPQFGSAANYESQLRRATNIGGVRGYEEGLRRLLRVQRYVELTSLAATVPQRSDIEESWHASHREFRFEWVAADVAAFDEAARAAEPTDEELTLWLANLSEFDRAQYRTAAKFRAELAGVVLTGDDRDLSALHAAHPRPEGWDDAIEGKAFYTQRYFTLYQKPKDASEADPADEDAVQDDTPEYYSYEEIADRAARDARTFAALRDWHTSLQGRLAIDEPIDMAAEAAALGLDHVLGESALSFEDWRELGGLSNQQVAARVASLAVAGELSPGVIVGSSGFTIARLLERTDPVLPPVSEIRDQLMTRWMEEKRLELAEEALEALRTQLVPSDDAAEEGDEGEELPEPTTTVSSEEFLAAVQAAGLRSGAREWLDRRAVESDDPNWTDPVHSLVRAHAQLYELEEGELSPTLRPFGAVDALYMLRADGSREIPFERIGPAAFQEARNQAKQQAALAFLGNGPFSDTALREMYGVWLRSEEDRLKQQQEAALQAEGQTGG